MIALGIDPGTAATGVAVLDIKNTKDKPIIVAVDTIKTPSDMEMHDRLRLVHEGLETIALKYSPDLMVIERLFFNTNVKTAMSVGQARGVSLLVAGQYKMQVREYTALEAKNILTGYGRATKKELQLAVMEYMNLEKVIRPNHANDALAMILCFIEKEYSLGS